MSQETEALGMGPDVEWLLKADTMVLLGLGRRGEPNPWCLQRGWSWGKSLG